MKPKSIAYATLLLGAFSLAGLLANIYLFKTQPEIVIEKSGLLLIPAIVYPLAFVFSILSLWFIISSLRRSTKFRAFKMFLLVLAVFSFISFMVDKVMIDELADDLRYGFDLSLGMLLFPLFFKAFYSLLIFILVFIEFSGTRNQTEEDTQDETIFTLAQIVGMVTGLLGIILVLSQIRTHQQNFLFQISVYIFFLVPYGLIVFYWLLLKLKRKVIELYDEKQWKDVFKAGLTTLLASVPGMALLLVIDKSLQFFWFPYYLFFILLVFSASTFFYYKKG